MRTATALRSPRLGRGWYLAAVLSAVLAVGMCLLGWRQADQADRIDAAPVRLDGTVSRVPTGSGSYSAVSYRVDGQDYTADALWLPDDVEAGDRICLERAASDPRAVRVCGRAYPQAAGVRLAQTSVPVALVGCLVCALRIWRHRRAYPARTTRSARTRTTVALGSEAPSRRRRGHRRALR